MKKALILMAVSILIFSCSSPFDKAVKLVKEDCKEECGDDLIQIKFETKELDKLISEEINDVIGYTLECYVSENLDGDTLNHKIKYTFNRDVSEITDSEYFFEKDVDVVKTFIQKMDSLGYEKDEIIDLAEKFLYDETGNFYPSQKAIEYLNDIKSEYSTEN